jgi:hypothetical protein
VGVLSLFLLQFFFLVIQANVYAATEPFLGPESRIDASSRHEVEEMH